MKNKVIYQAWLDYCRAVLPNEWTLTRAESISGKDGPRPAKPYLTLKLLSGPSKKTIDDPLVFNGEIEGEKNFDLVGIRGYTLSIQAFGREEKDEHVDALEDISTCLDDPDLKQILRDKANIGISSKGDVLDLSSLVETGFEGKASLDIAFNSSNNKETNVGLIENVEVSGQSSQNANEDPINSSITINKE